MRGGYEGEEDGGRQVEKIEEQREGTRLFPGRFSSEIAFGQVAVSSVALQMHRRCIESEENSIDRESEYKERLQSSKRRRRSEIRHGRA